MEITLEQLIGACACISQCRTFRKMFGDSVEVTHELCVSVADLFDFEWAARHLLFGDTLKAYHKATEPIRKAYGEAIAPAMNVYHEAYYAAIREYDASATRALRVYEEAIAPARKEYRELLAAAFATAYNGKHIKEPTT